MAIPAPDSAATRIAFRAAGACALLGIAYSVAQIFEWAGPRAERARGPATREQLGSAGGPASSSTALGLVLLLTPSLLLGSAFLILIAALHRLAAPEGRVFSQIALAFATIYATLISLVYFVQLTLIAPRLSTGDLAGLEPFLFIPYRSFLFAVDLLGYSFLSLATLAIAFALPPRAARGLAKGALIANGLLMPFLAFQMLIPGLIWVAALWGLTFPIAMITLAASLRRNDP